MKNADNNNIKQHYDTAKQHTLEERSSLHTYPLQVANNRLKEYLVTRHIKIGDRVLDMGCGKGGDGRRILAQRPRHYIGFDLSPESIKEATRRHGDFFFEGDMLSEVTFQNPLIQLAPIDVISSQFCLHYVWHKFDTLLRHLESITARGSVWIGTIVDSNQLEAFGKGNSIAQIQDKTSQDYVFSMPPLVNGVKEAIIPFQQFVTVTAAAGWQMAATGLFGGLHFGRHLEPQLAAIHNLYRYFVLIKT